MTAPSKPTALHLEKMREPFADNQISQLPKGNVMLSYVGHAALTDRLLDADLGWNWEPLAFTPQGLPQFDELGGLWIKLTVGGVTRLGYGDAGSKKGPNAIKEAIGDALRNAGMRFGAALDLWHKGDLHAAEEEAKRPSVTPAPERPATISANTARKGGDWERIEKGLKLQRTPDELREYINHADQKKIWSAWPQSWKIELRELLEHLKEKLEQEATDRVLDQAFDPRTGELVDEIPF